MPKVPAENKKVYRALEKAGVKAKPSEKQKTQTKPNKKKK